jgi:hypothetical protein
VDSGCNSIVVGGAVKIDDERPSNVQIVGVDNASTIQNTTEGKLNLETNRKFHMPMDSVVRTPSASANLMGTNYINDVLQCFCIFGNNKMYWVPYSKLQLNLADCVLQQDRSRKTGLHTISLHLRNAPTPKRLKKAVSFNAHVEVCATPPRAESTGEIYRTSIIDESTGCYKASYTHRDSDEETRAKFMLPQRLWKPLLQSGAEPRLDADPRSRNLPWMRSPPSRRSRNHPRETTVKIF